MSHEQELSVSLPLDTDGFLRRECPTCEREFKWRSSEEADAAEPVPESGYYCPYCAIQSPADAWWTKAQLELVQSVVSQEIIEPELKKLERALRDMSRQSSGLITAELDREPASDADPLVVETDEMRRVEFTCHPSEPVKVLDDWRSEVHCLICGKPAGNRSAD